MENPRNESGVVVLCKEGSESNYFHIMQMREIRKDDQLNTNDSIQASFLRVHLPKLPNFV